MNTKTVTDKTERKKLKRTARKKAAPKAKRAAGVARGSIEEKDPSPGSKASVSGNPEIQISDGRAGRPGRHARRHSPREPFPEDEYRRADRLF